jgi:hypothetical protein
MRIYPPTRPKPITSLIRSIITEGAWSDIKKAAEIVQSKRVAIALHGVKITAVSPVQPSYAAPTQVVRPANKQNPAVVASQAHTSARRGPNDPSMLTAVPPVVPKRSLPKEQKRARSPEKGGEVNGKRAASPPPKSKQLPTQPQQSVTKRLPGMSMMREARLAALHVAKNVKDASKRGGVKAQTKKVEQAQKAAVKKPENTAKQKVTKAAAAPRETKKRDTKAAASKAPKAEKEKEKPTPKPAKAAKLAKAAKPAKRTAKKRVKASKDGTSTDETAESDDDDDDDTDDDDDDVDDGRPRDE